MPMPRLIHPIPVEIRKADRKFTAAYDDNFREPVGQVRRKQKPIKLRAQLKIKDTDAATATAGGVQEQSNGYLLFLTADLKRAGVTIEIGDRVVKLGEGDNAREVDYYITKFYWRGHYPAAGGPTLLKAFFMDRQPSRQREDR
jgi:hypothetical protein